VAAISAREGTAFLSSGTWSLVGTELGFPCGHARCVAPELHQRRRREWNYETIEERDGTVDVAGLPEILDAQGLSYDYGELIDWHW
jgi:hypothetical protein